MNPPPNALDTVHIKDLRPGMKSFSITFIVLDVGVAVPLKENREVRTLKVADSTACMNLSLWDEPGATIMPGDIIRLTKAYVNIFRNCLTLYSGKNGDVDKIGEFCMVFNEQLNMSEPHMNFNNLGNQPGSGLGGNVNNSINNGNTEGVRSLQGRPASGLSERTSQGHQDRKNTSRYSNDRSERERDTPSGVKQSSKPSLRGGRGGQRNVIRSDKKS